MRRARSMLMGDQRLRGLRGVNLAQGYQHQERDCSADSIHPGIPA
jgi:hypothetical protein